MVWGNSCREAHARLKPQSASNNRLELVTGRSSVAWNVVDRPTQLICICNFYLSTEKYKRHCRATCTTTLSTHQYAFKALS